MNAVRAGMAYIENGFFSNVGLPDFTSFGHSHSNYEFWRKQLVKSNGVYTHYPQGPMILTGLMGSIVGFEDIDRLRLLPVSFGLLSTLLIAVVFATTLSAPRSLIALLAIVLIPITNTWMHQLHIGYSFSFYLMNLALLLYIYAKKSRLIGDGRVYYLCPDSFKGGFPLTISS